MQMQCLKRTNAIVGLLYEQTGFGVRVLHLGWNFDELCGMIKKDNLKALREEAICIAAVKKYRMCGHDIRCRYTGRIDSNS